MVMVKDLSGQILRDGVVVWSRWEECLDAGTECRRCQGSEYKCGCRLADASFERIE